MKVRLTPQDIRGRLIGSRPAYEKYVSPLINLANRFAQATRRNQVGQVSELIRECPAQDYEGWRDWYLARYPMAIDEATDRIVAMLDRMRDAMHEIDRETVRRWVTELVLEQTFVGLRVERAILEEAAHRLGMAFASRRGKTNPEESMATSTDDLFRSSRARTRRWMRLARRSTLA